MPGDTKEDANAKIPMIGSAVTRLAGAPMGCWQGTKDWMKTNMLLKLTIVGVLAGIFVGFMARMELRSSGLFLK